MGKGTLEEVMKAHTRHIDAHGKALVAILEGIEDLKKEIKKLKEFKKEFE